MPLSLPITGAAQPSPREPRTTSAGRRTWRPLLAATLGLFSLTGALAQNQPLPLPTSLAERVALPQPAAPRAELPAKTVKARQVLASISSTATGGNWSDPASWAGGVVPTSADDVTIVGGATVTLDVAASCASLTVATAGSLLTSATTAYSLQVGGSITNNGTLDLSANPTTGSDLRFTGAGSVTFSGSGTTDLQTVSLAKSARIDVVDMNLPTLSVKGSTTSGDGFLTTVNSVPAADMAGTLKISGTATISNKVFASGTSYTIPTTGGFWLSNPNYTVVAQNGTTTISGSLRVTAGTFNVGTAIGNSLALTAASVLTVDGGTINSASRVSSFTAAASAFSTTFTLSAGTINVNQVGNADLIPSFGINGTTAISGGTINLVQRSIGATPLDYYVAGTYTYSGGTVNVGTAATATNFDFRVRGTFPNLTLDNTTNPKSALLQGQTNVYGTTLTTPGSNLNLNGQLLLQLGAAITNNGTITGTTTASTIYFAGSVPQTLGGSGTYTLIRTISVDNSGGGATLTVPVTTTRVNLFTGNLNGTNNLTIGDGSAAFFVIQIGVASNVNTSGSLTSAPTFNIGSGALQLIYAQETTARTTGFEIPSARIVDALTMANPAGLIVAGGNLTINASGVSTGSLILTSGIITTSAANKIIIGKAAATLPTGSATSYVKGPLGITVNSATAVNRTFAVGDAGGWRPVVVTGITTSADQIFTATVINGATGGTPVPPVTNLNPTRYVRLENSANLPATARVQLSFGADDFAGNAGTATIAQAPSAAGAYASIGGAAAATPTTGIISTQNLTPGNDYFVLANTEGGQLSSSPVAVCTGTNAGTISLTNFVGTVVKYQFDNGSGFVDVPGNNNSPTLAFTNLTATTTYRAVILTSDGRTVFSAPVTVTVNPLPLASLTATSPTTFCGPGTLTLQANALSGATYQFLLNGNPISGATNATYSVTVAASGSYAVIVTSAAGCSATSSAVNVTVNPATSATFAYASGTFCKSGTNPAPTITGTTGGTFSSTSGLVIDPATGTINLAASNTGTYTVTYTVGGPCPVSSTATVTVTSAPVATFSYANAAYCVGGTNPAPVFPTGASGGTFTTSGSGLVINATTGVINLATSTAGTYTVVNTVAASGGCTAASATTTVTINARPATPTISVVYNGATTTLTSSSATGNQFYLNGNLSPGATGQTYVVNTPAQFGTYSVVVTNANGCASLPSATLTVTSAVKPLAGSSLSVFPNPTHDGKLSVELTGYRKAVELTVLNALGQPVFTTSVPASAGTTVKAVNLSQLPAGIYILRAKTEGGLDTRRIVKE
ncbi:T9SS type A sorting domain-containing protein [Hymenobacter persicinus]|uniref:T9SS type A sorting domain-containing protein n=1 Tax=Hymenobacter persicinus TaxID=2025506 RepID=A0A4Q5LCG8_9BACT|nr:T9SS type A sorting domain-containing protein [Hymenobacter persicinus]RYU80716.1 T9SS type A sorting domain-containing protein [Hymenobacter persicinus]